MASCVLTGVDDLRAQVHRVADRLLLVVQVREGDRRFAVADRDRPGVLDLLQRAFERLRVHRDGDERRERDREGQTVDLLHGFS